MIEFPRKKETNNKPRERREEREKVDGEERARTRGEQRIRWAKRSKSDEPDNMPRLATRKEGRGRVKGEDPVILRAGWSFLLMPPH